MISWVFFFMPHLLAVLVDTFEFLVVGGELLPNFLANVVPALAINVGSCENGTDPVKPWLA